jgi:hypothetical protein
MPNMASSPRDPTASTSGSVGKGFTRIALSTIEIRPCQRWVEGGVVSTDRRREAIQREISCVIIVCGKGTSHAHRTGIRISQGAFTDVAGRSHSRMLRCGG